MYQHTIISMSIRDVGDHEDGHKDGDSVGIQGPQFGMHK